MSSCKTESGHIGGCPKLRHEVFCVYPCRLRSWVEGGGAPAGLQPGDAWEEVLNQLPQEAAAELRNAGHGEADGPPGMCTHATPLIVTMAQCKGRVKE